MACNLTKRTLAATASLILLATNADGSCPAARSLYEGDGDQISAHSHSPHSFHMESSAIDSLQDMLSQQQQRVVDASSAPTSMLLRTFERASFADGSRAVNSTGRPNPRDVSNAFHRDAPTPSAHGASDWLWAFGQFLNHDISEVNVNSGDWCNISVSPDDPYLLNVTSIPMLRSRYRLDEADVAQQLSDMTSVIDAESVYGTTSSRLAYVRSDDSSVTGRLRTSARGLRRDLLPRNEVGLANRGGDGRSDLFLAGDVRANENTALLVTHNLWVREHNYWADSLREARPSLGGDEVFNLARVLVRAMVQKVVYDEFLPALLGEGSVPPYDGYRAERTGIYQGSGLENVVSSCAYRVGHTMVGGSLLRDYGNGTTERLAIEDAFFAPLQLEAYGLDPYLRGMATNTAEEVDPFLTPALRNRLFSGQFDLMALNIERARDHGIPDFNTIRKSVGYERLDSFDDFLFGEELMSVYENTDQIDCWVGMNAEPRVEGLMVGPTQRDILAKNFANIRDGDEYFYKRYIQDERLMELIESTTFSDVIRRNSDDPNSLDDIQGNVFFV